MAQAGQQQLLMQAGLAQQLQQASKVCITPTFIDLLYINGLHANTDPGVERHVRTEPTDRRSPTTSATVATNTTTTAEPAELESTAAVAATKSVEWAGRPTRAAWPDADQPATATSSNAPPEPGKAP